MEGTFNGAGAVVQYGQSILNNAIAGFRENRARHENYKYNEMAAKEADKRTRALYNDFYSPEAQIKQLKEAGLSPSVFYGDTPGSAGQSGAQGAGVSGIAPNIYGISALEGAQIDLMKAETNKVNEESGKVHKESELLSIEKSFKQIEYHLFHINYDALTEYVNVNGERQSLYEFAQTCTSYENFIYKLRKSGIQTDLVNTEQGQSALRSIFKATRELPHDIAILSEEEVSSNFQRAVVNELAKTEFAQKNAEAAVAQLRASVETNELTESQKKAWNNLLDKFGEKGSTTRDIVIIVGVLLQQALSHVNANVQIPSAKGKTKH